MTNEEAIKILKRGYPDSNRYAASELEVYEYDVETYNEAVEYAIKALETMEMIKTRYILIKKGVRDNPNDLMIGRVMGGEQ